MLLEKISTALLNDKKPCILVVGDAMVDHYIWGQANRLSPEAPVPVVEVRSESYTLGGAANVALNLHVLGVSVQLACIAGNDSALTQLQNLLAKNSLSNECVYTDGTRKTTVKTRVMAGSHQLVRIDNESLHALGHELIETITSELFTAIQRADIVLFSDYNKGMLTPGLCQNILQICRQEGKKVIIDPKGNDYSKYAGAFIIKPNRKELADVSGISTLITDADLLQAANVVFNQTGVGCLVVTLSEEGIAIITPQKIKRVSVKATDVFDVTGAGDTVLATMAYGLAVGLDIENACEMANHAAAIALRKVGNAAVSLPEIIENLKQHG